MQHQQMAAKSFGLQDRLCRVMKLPLRLEMGCMVTIQTTMAGITQGNGVTRGGEYVYSDIASHCIDGRDIVCIGWICIGYTLRFLYLGVGV
jgi:hypothetical protein